MAIATPKLRARARTRPASTRCAFAMLRQACVASALTDFQINRRIVYVAIRSGRRIDVTRCCLTDGGFGATILDDGRKDGCHRHCVRAVKEMDSKSIGLCPQGFESPRCRFFCIPSCYKKRAAPGIEPGTSRTLSENHTTRPSSQILCPSDQSTRNDKNRFGRHGGRI